MIILFISARMACQQTFAKHLFKKKKLNNLQNNKKNPMQDVIVIDSRTVTINQWIIMQILFHTFSYNAAQIVTFISNSPIINKEMK